MEISSSILNIQIQIEIDVTKETETGTLKMIIIIASLIVPWAGNSNKICSFSMLLWYYAHCTTQIALNSR